LSGVAPAHGKHGVGGAHQCRVPTTGEGMVTAGHGCDRCDPCDLRPVRSRDAILRPFYLVEAIGVAEAARQAGKSVRTVREWCLRHQIGRMIGGRWSISRAQS